MEESQTIAVKNDSEPPSSDDPLPEHRRSPAFAGREDTVMELFPYLNRVREERSRRQNPSTVRISSRSLQFLRTHYSNATIADWNDWHWQMRNSITSLEALARVIRLSEDEYEALYSQNGKLPLRITPYYASLIDPENPAQSIRRTVVPVIAEYLQSEGEAADPLSEESDSPVPGLVHRYPDRVLFLTTGVCSTYCRYCTRSRMVGDNAKSHMTLEQWDRAIDYIAKTPAIRDVLLSGGDPLTLADDVLEYLISRIKAIPHVEMVRLGTKVPVVMPQRVTSSLARMLSRYNSPLWINIHFTHPDELTPETRQACNRLADAGIPLGSQTVLLQGINDKAETLRKLYQGLLQVRVRPYYLYQCDPILGSSHFRTPVEKGIEMIQGLRGHTTGLAVPQYVIDAPGGGGKVPLLPEYNRGRDGGDIVLRNYEGKLFRYPDVIQA
jgi:lysine 2,3-aminomutase